MNIAINGKSEEVIADLVRTGRYATAEAAVNDIVLRFDWHEEVRVSIAASLAEDEGMSEAEFDAEVSAAVEELWQDRVAEPGNQPPSA